MDLADHRPATDDTATVVGGAYVPAAFRHRCWAGESAVFLSRDGSTLVVDTRLVEAMMKLARLGRAVAPDEIASVFGEMHAQQDDLIASLLETGLLEEADGTIAVHR